MRWYIVNGVICVSMGIVQIIMGKISGSSIYPAIFGICLVVIGAINLGRE